MAVIKAFRAIRPANGLESEIAALPYDVYNRDEAREEVKDKKLSFLNIDRPETFFPVGYDMYAPEVYERANEELRNMIAQGLFVQDENRGYYIYELTMNGRVQTGLVACASVDDYQNGVIKKHENTRAEKEVDRTNHIDVCNMQTGPIFLAYRKDETIRSVIHEVKQTECYFDFTSNDGIRHRGWTIFAPELIRRIEEEFSTIPQLYIADGHHRAASAVKVGLKRRAEALDCLERSDCMGRSECLEHSDYLNRSDCKKGLDSTNGTGDEEYNYFLSVLFSDDELMIMAYNRVVEDFNGLTREKFLEKVEEKFEISLSDCAVSPDAKGNFGMYLRGQWYSLSVKEEYKSSHPVDGLDVSILQNELLMPVLGIMDPRTDERIHFVGGIRGLKDLERRVDAGDAVAFSMYPTSIQELFEVADVGLLMPPKSTWFEPKLRSGLFLHELDVENND